MGERDRRTAKLKVDMSIFMLKQRERREERESEKRGRRQGVMDVERYIYRRCRVETLYVQFRSFCIHHFKNDLK